MSQDPRRAVASAGDDAIAWAESIGWRKRTGRGFYVLDEWQKFCIRGILSEDASARLCATIVLLLVPRQNGKNVVLEVVELYAFFVLELRYILHTAHLAETSADHMARLWEAIQSDRELRSRCRRVVANGKERIYWAEDGEPDEDDEDDDETPKHRTIRFRTRSKKIGRGGSPQMAVFDEALYLTDVQQAATLPSLSAQSALPDKPILLYTSSAPVVDEDEVDAEVVMRIRAAIQAGEMLDAWYAEWSCEPDPSLDWDEALRVLIADREALISANPGMPHRIDPDWVETVERVAMSPEAYACDRLGVIRPKADNATSLGRWPGLVDGRAKVVSHDAWALSTTPAFDGRGKPVKKVVSFGLAGRTASGRVLVECIARTGSSPEFSGTGWVIPFAVRQWKAKGLPIRVWKSGPEKEWIPLLREAGVEVIEVSTDEFGQATGQLINACADGTLVHLDQPSLNKAVAGAKDRTSTDGAAVWSQRNSQVEITPLVAVTVALGGVPQVDESEPVFAA